MRAQVAGMVCGVALLGCLATLVFAALVQRCEDQDKHCRHVSQRVCSETDRQHWSIFNSGNFSHRPAQLL
jgi:hypothetical protein